MKQENIQGELPRIKVRMGVFPTQQHRDQKVYSRKAKHKLPHGFGGDRDTSVSHQGLLKFL